MKAGRHPGRPRARPQPQSGVRGRARPQRCAPCGRKARAEGLKGPQASPPASPRAERAPGPRPAPVPAPTESPPRPREHSFPLPPPAIIPASTNHGARAPRRGLLLATTHVHRSPAVKAPQPICLPPSSPAFQAKSSAATEAGEQRGADFECSRGRLAANGEGRAGGRRGGDRLAGRWRRQGGRRALGLNSRRAVGVGRGRARARAGSWGRGG